MLLPLARALREAGVEDVFPIELIPNDGRATLAELAVHVANAARKLELATKFDIVGFSMGAVVSRYFIQRMNGRERVRRFISVAGPQSGTYTAHVFPHVGIRDMRRGSAVLADLAKDADPWGDVEVHTINTPFDSTVVPPSTTRLPHAKSHTSIPTLMHRYLITDKRALAHVTRLLTE